MFWRENESMTIESFCVKSQPGSAVPRHRLFKIRANDCNVRAGEHVVAETTVGYDFVTGEALSAGCRGVVEAVNWSTNDCALFVWVRMSG
jgi:hypothetical protein